MSTLPAHLIPLLHGNHPTQPFGSLPPDIRAAYPGAHVKIEAGTICICKWGEWGQTNAGYSARHYTVAQVLEREGIAEDELVGMMELAA